MAAPRYICPHNSKYRTELDLELTVRFIAPTHAVRALKDRMSRQILSGLGGVGISLASTTVELVGVPPVRLELGTAAT